MSDDFIDVRHHAHHHPPATTAGSCRRIVKDVWAYRQSLLLILTPVAASPLIWLVGSPQARCLFALIVMGVYWMLELLPLAVTALLPSVLYPMLGILSAKETCYKFLSHISFLFMGGLIMALAVEKSGLHRRVALRVLTIVGSEPHKIMLGFMAVTAFLSMWISNTATTAMMMPIAQSVINQLLDSRKTSKSKDDDFDFEKGENGVPLVEKNEKQTARDTDDDEIRMDELPAADRRLAKGFLLSICFAANIGGTGTLTGTPPNLVLIDLFDKLADCRYPDGSGFISFLGWMLFAIPLAVLQIVACWLVLALYYLEWGPIVASCDPRRWFGRRRQPPDAVATMMRHKYSRLPAMTFAEIWVSIWFLLLLALWIFRDPKVIPGFGELFRKKYYSDAVSAMLVAIILFAFPSQMPDFFWLRSPARRQHAPELRASLMDWSTMQHKFPWSVIILLGGGFALAAGVDKSGLSAQIGELLQGLDQLSPSLQLVLCLVVTVLVTNVCSNTVTAVIFNQIVAKLAETSGLHPLRFMAPTTLSTSLAFMLPVGTPPNAIVFASGMLTVSDMITSGALVTVVTLALLVAHMHSWALFVWPLAEYPSWAPEFNQTVVDPTLTAFNETLAVGNLSIVASTIAGVESFL